MVFETSRLILRSFEDRDIVPFAKYRSDPAIARYQGWESPFTIEQAAQFVKEMKSQLPGVPGQWYQLAIELKATGELIGDCAYQCLSEDARQAEIGFTLAQEFQGKGYAAEAVKRLLAFLLDESGLHRVRANCDPENHASARLMERVGMHHEGRFVESLWFKGHWADEDWYAILQSEWKESNLRVK